QNQGVGMKKLKDIPSKDFKIISTPEEIALLKKWNKRLLKHGLTKDAPREQSSGSLGKPTDLNEEDAAVQAVIEAHETKNPLDVAVQEFIEAHEIKDLRGVDNNEWRAGEYAPERHLVPQTPWFDRAIDQTPTEPRRGERLLPPPWANNNEQLRQVLQSKFPSLNPN